jgi:IS30 family transposase
MRRSGRTWMSAMQRLILWQRWQEGTPVCEIAAELGRRHRSVREAVVEAGGIAPRCHRRSARALTGPEREEIARGLCFGLSLRAIARSIGRPSSAVTREVSRNGGRVAYRALSAERRAAEQSLRPKECKLSTNRALCRVVASKLRRRWSPQQISRWLKRTYRNPSMRVSHETIYKSLFIQARGVLKTELLACLRSSKRARSPAKTSEKRGKIADAVSIRERPAEADDRAVPGHWEGDLLAGGGNTYIATLVERATRFVLLVKVDSKETRAVVDALIRQARALPTELRRSFTWDRGKEMADHRRFSLATDIKVYFCDPYSPWQRGSNENTNGLLRQYFPKGTDLSVFTQAQLDRVARELNGRPRMTLDWHMNRPGFPGGS